MLDKLAGELLSLFPQALALPGKVAQKKETLKVSVPADSKEGRALKKLFGQLESYHKYESGLVIEHQPVEGAAESFVAELRSAIDEEAQPSFDRGVARVTEDARRPSPNLVAAGLMETPYERGFNTDTPSARNNAEWVASMAADLRRTDGRKGPAQHDIT